MATTPPVSAPKNASDKSSPSDWVLETQTPGPDGKVVQQNLKLASGHTHTMVVKPGVQYKLSPAINPVKDPSLSLATDSSVSHAKKDLDLQVMLPGGGSLVLIDFYAGDAKAAPTKLQFTQLDGKEESVLSTLSKEAPVVTQASVPELSSPNTPLSSPNISATPVDKAPVKAGKDVVKSKTKGMNLFGDDEGSWLGILGLAGIGAALGGGGGGKSSGNNASTGAVSYTVFGNIYAGPLVSNSGGDYVVQAFNSAGNLVGSLAVNADGS